MYDSYKGTELSVPGALQHATEGQITYPGPAGVRDAAGEMGASSFVLWSLGIREV